MKAVKKDDATSSASRFCQREQAGQLLGVL